MDDELLRLAKLTSALPLAQMEKLVQAMRWMLALSRPALPLKPPPPPVPWRADVCRN